MKSRESQILLSRIYELLGRSEVLDPNDPVDYDCLLKINAKLEVLEKKLKSSYVHARAEKLKLRLIRCS